MITRILRRTHTAERFTFCHTVASAFSNHARIVMAGLVMLLLFTVVAGPSIVEGLARVRHNVHNTFASSDIWEAKALRPESPEPDSTSANSFTPEPQVINAPTNLVVYAASSAEITLSWTAPAGIVHHYEVERTESISKPFVFIANVEATIFDDTMVTNHHAYLYRVRAVGVGGECALIPSAPSNFVLGTAISFEFGKEKGIKELELEGKVIKAQHFHDLRTAVNAVRSAAALGPANWVRSPLNNLEIKAQDVQELRDRLAEALTALDIPVGAYDDPDLRTGADGTPVKVRAIHLEQLQTKSTRGSSSDSDQPAGYSDRAALGEFGEIKNLPLIPIHLSVLPDGRVLFWGRDRTLGANGQTVIDETGHSEAYVWDMKTDERLSVPNPTTNLFCSGHSFLPDGRLLVTGGHKDPNRDGDGEAHTNIFDFRSNSWVRGPEMNNGRWYPYNVTLGTGKTLIVSGSYFAQPGNSSAFNTVPQIYNPGIGLSDAGDKLFTRYPFLHLMPNGKVLQIQSPALFDLSDKKSRLFNPAATPNEAWLDFATTNDDHAIGSSVLFDSGRKVLIVGGFIPIGAQPNNTAEYFDLEAANATWTRVKSMNFKRAYQTATILPDGEVLVTGGVSCPGNIYINCTDRAPMNAEMWDATAFNVQSPTSTPWRTMARYKEVRAYHSVAALLPDATVLVGGGGRPGAVGEFYPNPNLTPSTPCSRITNNENADAKLFGHANVEIYSPPYLFNPDGSRITAARPVITSAPTTIPYGQTFYIGTSGAGPSPKVSLVRLPSVTHGFNQDQRQIFLGEAPDPPIQVLPSGINATMLADSNRCPPGYYMLFVLKNGVPSVSKIVRVGDVSIFLTEAPQATAGGNGLTWEQGLEFSSSVDGEITHIRYWKAPGETGPNDNRVHCDVVYHVGHIWAATGVGGPLATAPFLCETAYGWQQAELQTPLHITGGVRYRVTYNASVVVAKTFGALDSPITSGPLTAWGSYFSTPAGSFPTSGSGSNLFADVVFKPAP